LKAYGLKGTAELIVLEQHYALNSKIKSVNWKHINGNNVISFVSVLKQSNHKYVDVNVINLHFVNLNRNNPNLHTELSNKVSKEVFNVKKGIYNSDNATSLFYKMLNKKQL
jgi:hypothetical protein